MKLLFSEYPAIYEKYKFPYQVWAQEDSVQERNSLLAQGFLPTRQKIGLWYLARSGRVDLSLFEVTSENRRILKNTEGFNVQNVSVDMFKLTSEHIQLIQQFCKEIIGDPFSESSIKRVFSSHWSNMIFEWREGEKLIGLSPIMTTNDSIYYWYGFIDPEYSKSGLGMRMMLEATIKAKEESKSFAYVGTIYTNGSLYKTNLKGFHFFNGATWSNNEDELKYLFEKDASQKPSELFKDKDYLKLFHNAQNLGGLA